jgi:hypothetical protein
MVDIAPCQEFLITGTQPRKLYINNCDCRSEYVKPEVEESVYRHHIPPIYINVFDMVLKLAERTEF